MGDRSDKLFESVINDIREELSADVDLPIDNSLKDYSRVQFLGVWQKFVRCARRWATFNEKHGNDLKKKIQLQFGNVDSDGEPTLIKKERRCLRKDSRFAGNKADGTEESRLPRMQLQSCQITTEGEYYTGIFV